VEPSGPCPANANGLEPPSPRPAEERRPTLGLIQTREPTTARLWAACPDSSPIALNSPHLPFLPFVRFVVQPSAVARPRRTPTTPNRPKTLCQAVAPGPEGRQTIAQRVSAGFRPPMNTKPRRGDRFPASSHTGQQLPARTDSSRPLRSRRKEFTVHSFQFPVSHAAQRRQDRKASGFRPFPPSRLRVRPSGLNPKSMAAKITESRIRPLFPSDETAFLQRSHTRQTTPRDRHGTCCLRPKKASGQNPNARHD
jgi:hypothetical protein